MNRKKLLIAFYTILRKEIVRILRLWPQTLLPPLITVILYFIIFGDFMGARIGPILGVPYLDFIVPGLIMMTVINSAFANVVYSFYSAKFQREIEELLVSPMTMKVIMAGYICGGIFRGLIAGVMVLCTALFFWTPHFYDITIVIFYLIVSSLVFSLGGMFNAIFARKFDDITMFSSFVLVPLTYLGGVFYTIDFLPAPWNSISRLNPILYMMSGFRYGFYGITDIDILTGIVILILLATLLALVNVYLLERGVGIKE